MNILKKLNISKRVNKLQILILALLTATASANTGTTGTTGGTSTNTQINNAAFEVLTFGIDWAVISAKVAIVLGSILVFTLGLKIGLIAVQFAISWINRMVTGR